MKKMTFIVLAVLALAGCRREDVREFTVKVDGLVEADRTAITQALSPYGGIDKSKPYEFDLTAQTVKVRYDSMQLAKKNVEMALAQAGFVANGVTPESVGAKRKR